MTAILLISSNAPSSPQAWVCDDVGIVQMRKVVAERGHIAFYQEEILASIDIDAGGMIHADDPIMSFDVGGVVFKFWAHQVAMYVGYLEGVKPAGDCPAVTVIGGRWRRTVISMPRVRALVEAMKSKLNEAARLMAEVDQRRAAMLEQVNKDRVRVVVVDRVEGFEDDSR